MLQYMLWYNTERPHHSLNKKSPLQYFCDIMNSSKSEFSQTGMTYTRKNIFHFYDKILYKYLKIFWGVKYGRKKHKRSV
ncbi:hypothetical protein [Sulfurihydrogenibium sp.]|jgi:hypothetical protein|uniref:hypothetical protein n=1 Tax=Sulfurihydrogenibium sp. TaxID=2053621 RepID=UPI0026124BEA|nr:hypothetical protein [Sulfurihydrogenibium sp.]